MKNNSKHSTRIVAIAVCIVIFGFVVIGFGKAIGSLNGVGKMTTFGTDSNYKFLRGEHVSGKVHYASRSILEYKHTAYFIPVGTEYYYLIFNDDQSACICVRADKYWGDNFTNMISNDPEGIEIKGVVKRLDYRASSAVSDRIALLKEEGYSIKAETYVYIDLLSNQYATEALVSYLLLIIVVIAIILIIKYENQHKAEKKKKNNFVLILVLIGILDVIWIGLRSGLY